MQIGMSPCKPHICRLSPGPPATRCQLSIVSRGVDLDRGLLQSSPLEGLVSSSALVWLDKGFRSWVERVLVCSGVRDVETPVHGSTPTHRWNPCRKVVIHVAWHPGPAPTPRKIGLHGCSVVYICIPASAWYLPLAWYVPPRQVSACARCSTWRLPAPCALPAVTSLLPDMDIILATICRLYTL